MDGYDDARKAIQDTIGTTTTTPSELGWLGQLCTTGTDDSPPLLQVGGLVRCKKCRRVMFAAKAEAHFKVCELPSATVVPPKKLLAPVVKEKQSTGKRNNVDQPALERSVKHSRTTLDQVPKPPKPPKPVVEKVQENGKLTKLSKVTFPNAETLLRDITAYLKNNPIPINDTLKVLGDSTVERTPKRNDFQFFETSQRKQRNGNSIFIKVRNACTKQVLRRNCLAVCRRKRTQVDIEWMLQPVISRPSDSMPSRPWMHHSTGAYPPAAPPFLSSQWRLPTSQPTNKPLGTQEQFMGLIPGLLSASSFNNAGVAGDVTDQQAGWDPLRPSRERVRFNMAGGVARQSKVKMLDGPLHAQASMQPQSMPPGANGAQRMTAGSSQPSLWALQAASMQSYTKPGSSSQGQNALGSGQRQGGYTGPLQSMQQRTLGLPPGGPNTRQPSSKAKMLENVPGFLKRPGPAQRPSDPSGRPNMAMQTPYHVPAYSRDHQQSHYQQSHESQQGMAGMQGGPVSGDHGEPSQLQGFPAFNTSFPDTPAYPQQQQQQAAHAEAGNTTVVPLREDVQLREPAPFASLASGRTAGGAVRGLDLSEPFGSRTVRHAATSDSFPHPQGTASGAPNNASNTQHPTSNSAVPQAGHSQQSQSTSHGGQAAGTADAMLMATIAAMLKKEQATGGGGGATSSQSKEDAVAQILKKLQAMAKGNKSAPDINTGNASAALPDCTTNATADVGASMVPGNHQARVHAQSSGPRHNDQQFVAAGDRQPHKPQCPGQAAQHHDLHKPGDHQPGGHVHRNQLQSNTGSRNGGPPPESTSAGTGEFGNTDAVQDVMQQVRPGSQQTSLSKQQFEKPRAWGGPLSAPPIAPAIPKSAAAGNMPDAAPNPAHALAALMNIQALTAGMPGVLPGLSALTGSTAAGNPAAAAALGAPAPTPPAPPPAIPPQAALPPALQAVLGGMGGNAGLGVASTFPAPASGDSMQSQAQANSNVAAFQSALALIAAQHKDQQSQQAVPAAVPALSPLQAFLNLHQQPPALPSLPLIPPQPAAPDLSAFIGNLLNPTIPGAGTPAAAHAALMQQAAGLAGLGLHLPIPPAPLQQLPHANLHLPFSAQNTVNSIPSMHSRSHASMGSNPWQQQEQNSAPTSATAAENPLAALLSRLQQQPAHNQSGVAQFQNQAPAYAAAPNQARPAAGGLHDFPAVPPPHTWPGQQQQQGVWPTGSNFPAPGYPSWTDQAVSNGIDTQAAYHTQQQQHGHNQASRQQQQQQAWNQSQHWPHQR